MTRPMYPTNGTLDFKGLAAEVRIGVASVTRANNTRAVEVTFEPKNDKGIKALNQLTDTQLFMAAHTLIEELIVQVKSEGGGE